MSFLIKGGYDILRKQILNISLKPTTVWTNGILMVNENMYISSLTPNNKNKIEIVKYNNMNVLLLNDSIIYEDKQLFPFNLELYAQYEPYNNNNNLYDFMEYHYVDYNAIKQH